MNTRVTFLVVLAYAGSISNSYAEACVDKIPDCAEYMLDSCKPQYAHWAYEKCPAFCGFCRKQCANKRSDCHNLVNQCARHHTKHGQRGTVQNIAVIVGQNYFHLNFLFFIHEWITEESKCLYSPWMTLAPCSKPCGTCFTTQIRTQQHVPSGTPLAKDCSETLYKNKSCNTNPCKVPETVLNPDLVTIKNPVPVTEKTPVFVPDPVIVQKPGFHVDPVEAATAVGTVGTIGAIGVIGALLSENILPILPLFAFGKRSTTDDAAAFQNLIKEILIINAKNKDKEVEPLWAIFGPENF